MWLINVQTMRLELHIGQHSAANTVLLFGTKSIPPYAILSHRWSDDEITYRDFQERLDSCEQKTGFRKIKMTCEQARKDGLDYAWVDTCCIDKSSSAELQEAINSMFTWYAKSKKCYAYLEDIDTQRPSGTRPSASTSLTVLFNELPSQADLSGSEWFTRGWTLQELIAPNEVQFFDYHWNHLGSRTGMSAMLSDKTGIDEAILGRQRKGSIESLLSQLSVAQRMSWAANRNTTRTEDRAYCLLGLFDIRMPLLYGEGAMAFFRLQEEIMRQSRDLSLLAWSSFASKNYGVSLGVLAQTPADFSLSAGLVGCQFPWDGRKVYNKPELSFLDLRLMLCVMMWSDPIPKGPRYGLVALLDHRHESDPTKVIGLRLSCSDIDESKWLAAHNTAEIRKLEVPKSPLYCWVGWNEFDSSLSAYRRTIDDRLVLIDVLTAIDQAVPRELVISNRRRDPLRRLLHGVSFRTPPSVEYAWIRLPDEIAPAWKLLDSWPVGSWNNVSNIYSLPRTVSAARDALPDASNKLDGRVERTTAAVLQHASGLQVVLVCAFVGRVDVKQVVRYGSTGSDLHAYHIELYHDQNLEALSTSMTKPESPKSKVLVLDGGSISLVTRQFDFDVSRFHIIEPLCEGHLFTGR